MAALDSQHMSKTAAPTMASGLIARARRWIADQSDTRLAQKMAGNVFLVRVASAALALASQVLMARWMGPHEFGIYIYVWTWVLLIGALSDFGLSSAARRFIPEYTELKRFGHLRGFLTGSCWLAFAIATTIGAVGALLVYLTIPWLDHYMIVPLFLACAIIPVYGLVQIQAGIAQSYDWPNLALMPFYIWRQLAVTVLIGAAWVFGYATDAVTAMIIAAGASWVVTLVQLYVLQRRLRNRVETGAKNYEPRTWIATSFPIFMVEAFYQMLTYVDVLTLERYETPEAVATYYAAARILALVAFVYFAISGATTHRFSEYHVAGNKEGLAAFYAQTTRWTFWPSVAACAVILALGWPILRLFGEHFVTAYPVMFLLAIGMLARASVGPAERLLNMLGERRSCVIIYAAAFFLNLVLCTLMIPHFGSEGAAAATSTALAIESLLLYIVARWRLGFHTFVFGGKH